MEKPPPEDTSAASSPLSRVHRRQGEAKDVTVAASEGESTSETSRKLHLCLHNEVNQSEVHTTDDTTHELKPNSNELPGEFSLISPFQTLAHEDDMDVPAIQHSDSDDTSFSEFSQLRLQMKSLMQIETKTTNNEEVTDPYSSDIITNHAMESHTVVFPSDYNEVGGYSSSDQLKNRPYERKLKHRTHKRNVLESQNNGISGDRSSSLSEASKTNIDGKIAISEAPRYPHEVTVDVKPGEVVLQEGQPTPREECPSMMSIQPVAETAPPRETILSPICLPQIVLEPGPTVKYIAKPNPGVVKVDAQSQSSMMKTPSPSTSTDSTTVQVSPPPYSECMRHLESPIAGEIIQPAPRVSRKTLQSARKPESLPPLCRTGANLYGTSGAGYSQFHNSGTSLLDANISIYTRNKPDAQVSMEAGRTTFIDNEHQLLAFISCLFCWPIGLVAIYYSNMCQILKAEGNHEQAQVYGRQAFIVSTLAMCAGSLTYIIMLIYQRAG